MKFLYPEFLYALFALAIPLIIHLFNFRRYRRVNFTNVAFLREVNERTQSTRQLRHLWVLLARLLFVTALVLAFAQPVIPGKDAAAVSAGKAVSIFVDNSFSMQTENEEGPLLLQAIEAARQVALSFPPSAGFQLLTHDFEGRHQRFTTREDFLEMLEEINISSSSRQLSEIISRQTDLLSTSEDESTHLYIVSDFQQKQCDFDAIQVDTVHQRHFVLIPNQVTGNMYIDSLWFSTPFHNLNQQEKLNVRVRNHSEKSAEDLPVSLWINDSQAAIGTYPVNPMSGTDTALFFNNDQPGVMHGFIDIDDYPITFDDRFYFSYQVDSSLSVLEIYEETQAGQRSFIERIFSDDPQYQFERQQLKMIDYGAIGDRDFVVLNELNTISSGLSDALFSFASQGGAVLLIPGQSIDAESLNQFQRRFNASTFEKVVSVDTRVGSIDDQAPFFGNLFERIPRNMDFPSVKSYYKLNSPNASNDRALMALQNGDPFLSYAPAGNGSLFTLAVPLDTEKNNFARHALFVASILRMSELSRPASELSYTLGDNITVSTGNRVPGENEVFKIRSRDLNTELIPEFSQINGKGYVFVPDDFTESGNFELVLGNEVIAGLAFNYPRSESKLDYFKSEEINDALTREGIEDIKILAETGDSLQASLSQMEAGRKLWKWFIVIALIFILIETLLLKLWK